MSAQPFVKPTSEFDRRTLGKYELLCRLSTGGMSEIFLATQRGLAGFRKIVVLKSILPDIRGEEEFVKMFLEEARTTAAFNHPNIAQVFDLDTDDGTLFLAMEFVQGATLVEMARACRQAKEPIPLGFTLASVRDTALALHYAHTFIDPRGRKQVVIHRDVAEKNIMVSYDGTTKLLDFGIAKALGRLSGNMTSIGMVKGTSGYMSPEQIRGEPLDPRSDVFALGVVLHECLTGMRLFHGKSAEDGMLAALREDVAPPSRLSPDVTPALDAVCLKALARDREQRYGTALEFARAIEKACPGALWHAEQSGDLVQRFYNERRQQTRDLVENAQGNSELTGELKLDKVLAVVTNRMAASARPPTPPKGAPVMSPPVGGPRRVTAVVAKPPPGVAPRSSGEKPQLSTDPVGIDVRLTRAPAQPPPAAGHEATELAKVPGGRSENFDPDDDDDPGAKTMPATSLPPELLAQYRDNRNRANPAPDEQPTRPPRAPITDEQTGGSRQSNVVLQPIADRAPDPTGPAGRTKPEGRPFDPFSDLVEEPESKTTVNRPYDTSADAEPEPQPDESFEREPTAVGPSDPPPDDEEDDIGVATRTGVPIGRRSGNGRFLVIGVGLAVVALIGLFAMKLPPFSPAAALGPQPAGPLPGAPPKPLSLKREPPAVVKAEPKPEPVVKHEPEPKPEPVVKHEPEPKPEPRPRPEPVVKKAEPKPPHKAPVVKKEPEPKPEPVVKRKPEPKSDSPALLGSVSLVVDPPVHVFFGGKDLGQTPLKATLPVGKQSLKLVPSSGASKTVSVDVKESGGAARFDLEDL